MRVLYDNIIDDLTATAITALTTATGSSVLNVQNQRLALTYDTDSATSQSVTFTLDTFPEYPDDVAGTTYAQNDFATVDGWATMGADTVVSVANGELILTKGSTPTTFVRANKSLNISSKSVRVKWRSAQTDLTTLEIGTSGAGTHVTFSIAGRTSGVVDLSTGANFTDTELIFNSTGNNVNPVYIDWIYIGSGLYNKTAFDFSGNLNHGTVSNMTPVVGISGRGFRSDGIKGYVSTPVTLLSQTGFTLATWYAPSAVDSADRFLISKNNARPWLRLAATNKFQVGSYTTGTTGGAVVEGTTTAQAGTSYFVAATHDGTTLKLYVNGILESQSTQALNITDVAFLLGALTTTSGSIKGILDEPRIYNRALSAQELSNIQNCIPWLNEFEGLVGLWELDYGLGINSAAILGHNITPMCTVKIQGTNNNLNFDAAEVDETIVSNTNAMLKFLSAKAYYKYWKFSFTGQASLQIGRLWLGSYETIDPSSLIDFSVSKRRNDNIIRGKNHQKFALIGEKWREFNLAFPASDEDMIYKISQLYDTVGNHSSFIFCNFDTIRDFVLVEPCYVSIMNELQFEHSNLMRFAYKLQLQEEL